MCMFYNNTRLGKLSQQLILPKRKPKRAYYVGSGLGRILFKWFRIRLYLLRIPDR